MLRTLFTLSVFSLAGCGGGDEPAYDEPTFIDAYVGVLCAHELRCYEGTSPFDDEAACQDAAYDYGYADFGEGCTFDPEAAADCVDEFDRSGCIDYFDQERPASCAAVFSGDCAWPDHYAE